eukprot:s2615_g4.t1
MDFKKGIQCWKPCDPPDQMQHLVGENALVTGIIKELADPSDLAIMPTGEIFVGDRGYEKRLVCFQNGSGRLVLDDVDAVAVCSSPNGVLYLLTSSALQKLVGYELQTVMNRHNLPEHLDFCSHAMFVTKDEVIYIVDCLNDRILRFNPVVRRSPRILLRKAQEMTQLLAFLQDETIGPGMNRSQVQEAPRVVHEPLGVLMSNRKANKAYEELVASQCKALQEVLLRQHHLELDALRRELTREATEVSAEGLEEREAQEESEASTAHLRWTRLTEKLLCEQEWLENVTGLNPVEKEITQHQDIHMRRANRKRSRTMRFSVGPGNLNLKINEACPGRVHYPWVWMGKRPMWRYGSTKEAQTDDSLLQRFVVEPQSNVQLAWSIAACILILWDMITIPLEFFDSQEVEEVQSVVNIVTFAFWIIDMPLNGFFGVHRNGVVELRPNVLFSLYLRSWFGVDLMIISIDIARFIAEAAFGDTMSTTLTSGRYLRALRILRLLRLTRIGKLQKKFSILATRFFSTYVFMVLKVVWTLMLMLAINHLIACCWYGITTLEPDGSTWLAQVDNSRVNVYDPWQMTQFTPSTNNIAPANGLERSFAVFVILLAMGFFSSFVGSITATVNSLRHIQAAKDTLLQFFVERNMSLDLYSKVQDVIKSENLAEIRLHETEVTLVNSLPERFRMQLHEDMYMNSLLKLECWPKDMSKDMLTEPENEVFLRQICHHAMSEGVLKRGEDLFLPYKDCHHVYFVEQGHGLKYASHGRSTLVMQGDSLCLPAIWAEWHYCGRCTAESGAGYVTRVHGETFANLAVKFAGEVTRYLQIFGILLVGALAPWPSAVVENEEADDLCFKTEKMDALASRARIFADGTKSHGSLFDKSVSREMPNVHLEKTGDCHEVASNFPMLLLATRRPEEQLGPLVAFLRSLGVAPNATKALQFYAWPNAAEMLRETAPWKALGKLREHRVGMFCIFISHQWLGNVHPDPTGSQFKILKAAMKKVVDGSISVEGDVSAQLRFGTMRLSRAERDRIRNGYVWFDWFSVPQIAVREAHEADEHEFADDTCLCVKSIPSYVEKCQVFVALVPRLLHADTWLQGLGLQGRWVAGLDRGTVCNYSTWLDRGWCRAEMWCKVLSEASDIPMIVIESEDKAEFLFPFNWNRKVAHEADFTVEADRREVSEMSRKALLGKLTARGAQLAQYRYFAACSTRITDYYCLSSTILESGIKSEEFLSFFRFPSLKDAIAPAGYSGLACATLSGDLPMMRQLIRAKASPDAPLPPLLKVGQYGAWRCLHLAAHQGLRGEDALLTLLELRASPNLAETSGSSPLGFCSTTKAVDTLVKWKAEVNYTTAPSQVTPLSTAVALLAPVEVVIRLLEVKADPMHTGGGPDCGPLDSLPFMSNAGSHSLEIAQLLIDARADVNKSSRPRGLHYLFHRACQSYMRYLTSNPPVSIRMCAEITTTPLGKACFLGDLKGLGLFSPRFHEIGSLVPAQVFFQLTSRVLPFKS